MRNPFRSEGDAFRFVLLTIGYFALIVIGSVINSWVGLAVFLVLTARRAVVRSSGGGEPEAPVQQAPAASPPDERRILVVANETVGGLELLVGDPHPFERRRVASCSSSARRSTRRCGTGSRTRTRRARRRRQRLDAASARCAPPGSTRPARSATATRIQAIEDALRTFRPDELIISTHPVGRSHWLERGVVEKARERFALPVTHVVVDLDA